MLTDMSAATDTRRGAASGSNDDSVHEDLVIYTATYHKIPRLVRPRLPTDTTTMEATRKLTSLAARSGTADNQRTAELTINTPSFTAYYRHIAASIDGSGGPDMDPMMPKKRRTMAYGATTHGMNEASADEWFEQGQASRQNNGVMFVIVIVAPGDEDVHDMTAKPAYQRDDTRPNN